MAVQVGETYGKPRADGGYVLYTVVGRHKDILVLRGAGRGAVEFDSTEEKLARGGYVLVSQAPYLPPHAKRRTRPTRCPYTVDFIEGRSDREPPVPRPA